MEENPESCSGQLSLLGPSGAMLGCQWSCPGCLSEQMEPLIQQFESEIGSGKGVTMVKERGMGFGNGMEVRKWMEVGERKREQTGMGMEMEMEMETQAGIEMGMMEKRMEMGTWML